MALDSVVELYAPITGRASDGTPKPVWQYSGFGGGIWEDTLVWDDSKMWYDGASDTIVTDVQPKSLTQAQIQTWGLDVSAQDAKAVYDFSFSAYWVVGNRVRVDYDKMFRIMSVNPWNSHLEAILAPLVGT